MQPMSRLQYIFLLSCVLLWTPRVVYSDLIYTISDSGTPGTVNWTATSTNGGLLPTTFSAGALVTSRAPRYPDGASGIWNHVHILPLVSPSNIVDVDLNDHFAWTGTWSFDYDFSDASGIPDFSTSFKGGVDELDIFQNGLGDFVRASHTVLSGVTYDYPSFSAGNLESIDWSGSGTIVLGGTNTFESVFNIGKVTFAAPGGNVHFVVSSVPEPTSLILGWSVLLIFFVRRR